jgi:hypothetical protein
MAAAMTVTAIGLFCLLLFFLRGILHLNLEFVQGWNFMWLNFTSGKGENPFQYRECGKH